MASSTQLLTPTVAPVPWRPTIHSATVGVVAATAAAATLWSTWNPAVGIVGMCVTAAVRTAVRHVFPVDLPVERYRDVFLREQHKHSRHDEHSAMKQKYNVGFRYIAADGRGLPHCSCFYPTDANVTTDDVNLPRFTPLNDLRYAHGFARYARVPGFLANHQMDIKLRVAVDAPVVLRNGDSFGTKANPVIIFSHGLAGHQHMYSHFAADLASMGAIVICVQHTDGSACFALTPPEGNRGDIPVSHQRGIPYEIAPADDAENGFPFRQTQLKAKRTPELSRVIEFATGAALRTLLGVSQDSERGAVPVTLIGHSFGGTTVVSTAARAATVIREKIASVVALDLWTEPLANDEFNTALQQNASLPPLLLLDSQHWERWQANLDNELHLISAWRNAGSSVIREVRNQTDHLTLSVLRNLINLQTPRRAYCAKDDDRRHTAFWATQAFEFAGAQLRE